MAYGGKPHTDFQKYIRLKRTGEFEIIYVLYCFRTIFFTSKFFIAKLFDLNCEYIKSNWQHRKCWYQLCNTNYIIISWELNIFISITYIIVFNYMLNFCCIIDLYPISAFQILFYAFWLATLHSFCQILYISFGTGAIKFVSPFT